MSSLRPIENKCPSCNTPLPPHASAQQLSFAKSENAGLRKRIAELQAAAERVNEQEDDKRAELLKRVQRAELEALEARKELAAARRDLTTVHEALTRWIATLSREAQTVPAVRAISEAAGAEIVSAEIQPEPTT